MKVFLIADTHFGTHIINHNFWLNMMSDYFDNFFIPLLKEKAKPGDILIHLGDLYDNRTHIPIDVLNRVEQIMVEISKILPIHLIVGNHDIFNKSTNDINSPKALNWIPNINIYDKTTILDFCNRKLVLMPWVEKRTDQSILLKKYSGGDYLFCHSDLNNCRMHLSSVAWKNDNKIDIEEFASYEYCYSGHIHIRQKNKNFTFVGSPYQMDRNDMNDTKGVYILDIETGTEEFIENTLSPVFIKLEVLTEDDIHKLETIDTSKDYVDLYISNSLLMNNRKVRKNIEFSLEKGNFSRVEYINDIKDEKKDIENEEIENELSDIDFSNIKTVEIEDIVLRYIENQNYEDNNIKNGMIKEYEKILNIYKSEYKFKK